MVFWKPLFLLSSKHTPLLISTLVMPYFCYPFTSVQVGRSSYWKCHIFLLFMKSKTENQVATYGQLLPLPARLCLRFDFVLLIIISY